MTSNGVLNTLAHFYYTNGAGPFADLVYGNDGALYGTTVAGGTWGHGTVFRMTTNGALTTLASFDGTNGYYPYSNLIVNDDGSFYGTTYRGHYPDSSTTPGSVFRLLPGDILTNLVDLPFPSGMNPVGKFTRGFDGAFYGSAQSGAVFKVTINGELSVFAILDPFTYPSPGDQPLGGLAQGSDGNFYGTAYGGGAFGYGTVFRVTTNGLVSALASFATTNGASPRAPLVQGNDGAFYGTTPTGGSLGGGNVFRIQVFSHIESVKRIGSSWQVAIRGVEGESYRLERSTNLAGPWLALTNFIMDATQRLVCLDTNAPVSAAYYRTVTP